MILETIIFIITVSLFAYFIPEIILASLIFRKHLKLDSDMKMPLTDIIISENIRRKNNDEIPLKYGRQSYYFGDEYSYKFELTNFLDKNKLIICTTFLCITYARYGRKWYGIILKDIFQKVYAGELEVVGIRTANI